MGTFLTQDTEPVLYAAGDKAPAPGVTRRPGWTDNNELKAVEANALRDGLLDVRTGLRDGAAPVLATGSTTRRTLAQRFGWLFDIRDFGAVCNGTTDDTAAVNAAIAAASAAQGGQVLIPVGTTGIRPDLQRLVLRSNVAIIGQGEGSVLKVLPATGNYGVVFAPAANGDAVSNVYLSGFRLDQNAPNVTGNVALGAAAAQVAVQVYAGENVTVERVRFDCAGVNTVVLNGSSLRRASVRGCHFKFTPKGGVAAYDNSAVYFDCAEHECIGNTFEATIGSGARACIETHAGPSVVVGNRSDGYLTGANLVSNNASVADTRPGSDLLVMGNTFARCNWGVQLWSVTGRVLSNVLVASNVISVAQVSHAQSSAAGVNFVYDSGGSLSGTFRNVNIVGNTITHELEVLAGHAMADAYLTAGVCAFGAGAWEGGSILGNTIERAPATGIRLGNYLTSAPIKRVRVSGNVLVDFGSNAALTTAFRAGFFLGSALTDVSIEDNTLAETISPARAQYGVYFDNGAANSATRCTYRNNPTTTAAGLGIFNLVQQTGLKRDLSGEASWDPPSVASGASTSTTVTVTGAVVGDEVAVRLTQPVAAGCVMWGNVTAADTVTVTLANLSGGAVDVLGGSVRVQVTQR